MMSTHTFSPVEQFKKARELLISQGKNFPRREDFPSEEDFIAVLLAYVKEQTSLAYTLMDNQLGGSPCSQDQS